jgi:hypothetical protein
MENPTKVNVPSSNIYFDFHFHSGIKATGRKAKWTAAGLFKMENGKITL